MIWGYLIFYFFRWIIWRFSLIITICIPEKSRCKVEVILYSICLYLVYCHSLLSFPVYGKLTKTSIIFSCFALIHIGIASLICVASTWNNVGWLSHRRRGSLLLGANAKLLKFIIGNTTLTIVFIFFLGAFPSE